MLRLRGALVPYLYTTARQAYDTGVPMVRNLYLQWPQLEAAYQFPTEYMLGNDMLVAPVTAAGNPAPASVWIPPGSWVDYFTGASYTGPATVQLSVPLDQMPVFLRAGAILPTQPDLATTSAAPQDPLVVTAFPRGNGTFNLYDDQGQGFGYQSGAFAWTRISHSQLGSRSSVTIDPAQGTFPGSPAARSWEVRLRGVDRPGQVTINGQAVSGWSYDGSSRTLAVRTPQMSTSQAFTVISS
jgi:alpha-glucosidase (family GH31 glycosyl hydrolase)